MKPAGFSDEDTALWLKAATATLAELPADLLERGIKRARLVADHPSKIVPAIWKEVGEAWETRQRMQRVSARPAPEPVQEMELIEEQPEPMPIEEIRRLSPQLQRLGLSKGWITQEQLDEAFPAAHAGPET